MVAAETVAEAEAVMEVVAEVAAAPETVRSCGSEPRGRRHRTTQRDPD